MSSSPTLVYLVLLFGLLSLAALLFFIARAGISRFWPSASHPNSIAVLLTMGTTPLVCIGGVYLFLAIYLHYPHRAFDRHAWATNQSKRYEMTDDLLESRQLIGMTQEQVNALLGAPYMRQEGKWEYYLGVIPKLASIDEDSLLLEFCNGKVVRCQVHQT